MTREEKISKAAYSQYCNSESICFNLMCDSFKQGAEWADNHPINVWHDANDEPKDDMDILCITKKGKVQKVSKIENVLYNWLKDNDGIKKWAYINDLLPKE